MTTQTLEECLTEHGYLIPDYSLDGITRFNAIDKSKRNKSCWIKVFPDGGAAFGNWATGEQYSYHPKGKYLPKDEWIKLQEERKKERAIFEAEQLKQHVNKAHEALDIIKKAIPAPSDHPYLVNKGIQSHGALFGNILSYKDALIIPVTGSEQPLVNQVQSLQFILPNGSKCFLSGGKMKGGYYPVQTIEDAPLVICESFSTGATLAELYTPFSTVICAFNAGNLLDVAKYFRRCYPMHQITIAGDNDHTNKINIGRIKATEAAKAVNGMVSIPEFEEGETGSDWNDRHHLDNLLETSQ